ncbi:DUF6624 domain-containing protein [Maribacter sp. 2308TA10-17]|uniref:DUF6624 domain-containing protein n=1 Tax=Maribacter sp. 2308TA10-17 TaxID=3386276 RepID=UPI0039BC82B6
MKYLLTSFFAVLLFAPISAQEDLNKDLKKTLDSILYKDQKLREVLMGDISGNEKVQVLKEFGLTIEEFENQTWPIIARQDSLNLVEVEKVIREYGYPGKSLVGEPTNKAAWYVIQHSDKIEEYFPIIETAGKVDELPMRLVAMMQDRMLMNQNKPQIYGTQVAGRKLGASDEWFNFVWPIEDAKNVNKRRKNAGFINSVEENAKRMEVEYQVYTIKQIDSILNQNN